MMRNWLSREPLAYVVMKKSWEFAVNIKKTVEPLYEDLESAKADEVDTSALIARQSQGSVLLQDGKFTTEDDVNMRRDNLNGYDFRDLGNGKSKKQRLESRKLKRWN
jgi:hypothetical protein